MRKNTFTQQFYEVLDATAGMHSRIAAECGIGQATICRAYQRKGSPRLDTAQAIMDWAKKNPKLARDGRPRLTPRAPIVTHAVGGGGGGAAAPLG